MAEERQGLKHLTLDKVRAVARHTPPQYLQNLAEGLVVYKFCRRCQRAGQPHPLCKNKTRARVCVECGRKRYTAVNASNWERIKSDPVRHARRKAANLEHQRRRKERLRALVAVSKELTYCYLEGLDGRPVLKKLHDLELPTERAPYGSLVPKTAKRKKSKKPQSWIADLAAEF